MDWQFFHMCAWFGICYAVLAFCLSRSNTGKSQDHGVYCERCQFLSATHVSENEQLCDFCWQRRHALHIVSTSHEARVAS